MRPPRSLAVILLVALIAVTGCATVKGFLGQKSVGQSLIVSGESLDFTSKQFFNAGTEFTERCKVPRKLSLETCNDFDRFGTKFKGVWPHVTAAWRIAVSSRDTALQANQEKSAQELYAELLTFISKLGGR